MVTKSKQGQKGAESHGKQGSTRPGSEQTRSGTSMERQQQPKSGEQIKQKEDQTKSGKK